MSISICLFASRWISHGTVQEKMGVESVVVAQSAGSTRRKSHAVSSMKSPFKLGVQRGKLFKVRPVPRKSRGTLFASGACSDTSARAAPQASSAKARVRAIGIALFDINFIVSSTPADTHFKKYFVKKYGG
ncbi:hypothetical protein [Janthinobacterium sp.]|uniref:hypothetical protein n=1 Tax=Janthinobacterium sp. TaxID=1871054 RepID=UPI00293D6A1A|nr:hypothetical protein [Janthinobacterium sp.]